MKEVYSISIIGNVKIENDNIVLEYYNVNNLYVIIPTNSLDNYFNNRSLIDKWIDKTDYLSYD